MNEPSISVAAIAAFSFAGGLLVERMMLTRRPLWYFSVGIPVVPALVPIPAVTERLAGKTKTVHWERRDDVVFFWAPPGARTAPTGFHGLVTLNRTTRGVQLDVRWAPPAAPLAAAAWLAGLGLARGEALTTVPIATIMVLGILVLYRTFAVRAAAELRWALQPAADGEAD